ncbi:MAG TPA: hypothetical protein VIY48_04335 [Candidatus Paceibacterota bacterium]
MAKKTKKTKAPLKRKSASVGLNVTQFNDRWSEIQTKLEAVAAEQVQADIQVVNTSNALKLAQQAHQKAIARKTVAEKRLSTLRANLGGE